jgi:hypothetical protein
VVLGKAVKVFEGSKELITCSPLLSPSLSNCILSGSISSTLPRSPFLTQANLTPFQRPEILGMDVGTWSGNALLSGQLITCIIMRSNGFILKGHKGGGGFLALQINYSFYIIQIL